MSAGLLEIVLVGARGIKHVNHIGTPVYHAILECGDKVYHSKYSLGMRSKKGKHREVLWNQKFKFEFSAADWSRLMYIKIKIMNSRILRATKFMGQALVHIGGIVEEGMSRGVFEVKQHVYNVVIEDDTYRGEIKLGMKFMVIRGDEATSKQTSLEDSTETSLSTDPKLLRQLWLKLRKMVLCSRTENQN